MATRRAVANGNWSATATWNGGVVPGNGDTVYAGGFNVTLDVDVTIGGANNPTVSAGSFVAGQWYEITFVGTTSWTAIGAASNTLGVVFLATGAGSGTGEAKARATISTAANTSAGAAAGGSFIMSTVRTFTADVRAGSTLCLDVTASSGTLSLDGLLLVGGTANNAFALRNNSTATIDIINGTTLTGGSANGGTCCNNSSTGAITITSCTLLGSTASALNNGSSGSVTLTSCTITGGGGGNSPHGIVNSSTGSITVTSGTITGGASGAGGPTGIVNSSTGTITASSSTFTAGAATAALALNNSSTGAVTVTTSTFTASSANAAVSIGNTAADVRLSGDFLDHWSGWRAVNGAKWRVHTTPTNARTRYALDGTTDSYLNMFTADNNLTQALPADVRSGTVYADGNLTGTLAVPAAASVAFGVPVDNTTGTAALTPASVWDHLLSAITTSDTIGTLLKTNIDATISSRSTATTAGIADAVWDEILNGSTHNVAGSAGRRLRILDEERIITDGQVQSATTNTVTLEPIGTLCVGQTIVVTDQSTGDKQTRFILAFDTGTDTATVDSNWCAIPTAGDEYLLTTVRDPLVTRGDHPAGTVGAEIDEMYLLQGLKSGEALTVTPTSRTAGAISQTISGDGTTTTTVSRD